VPHLSLRALIKQWQAMHLRKHADEARVLDATRLELQATLSAMQRAHQGDVHNLSGVISDLKERVARLEDRAWRHEGKE